MMIGSWGFFVGLFPPAFLQDEVEALDRRDSLYGGAFRTGIPEASRNTWAPIGAWAASLAA